MILENNKSLCHQKDDDDLNNFIYEYLIKNNFNEIADIFKREANITSVPLLNSKKPFLSTWYNIFQETCEYTHKEKYHSSFSRVSQVLKKIEIQKSRFSELLNYSALNEISIKFRSYALTNKINLNFGYVKNIFIIKEFLIVYNDRNIFIYNTTKNMTEITITEQFIHSLDVEEIDEGFLLSYVFEYCCVKTFRHIKEEFKEISLINIIQGVKEIKIINNKIFALIYPGYIKEFTIEGKKIENDNFLCYQVIKNINKYKNNVFLYCNNNQLIEFDTENNIEISKIKDLFNLKLIIKKNMIFTLTNTIEVYKESLKKKISCFIFNSHVKDIDIYNNEFLIISNSLLHLGIEINRIPNIKFINVCHINKTEGIMVMTENSNLLFFKPEEWKKL